MIVAVFATDSPKGFQAPELLRFYRRGQVASLSVFGLCAPLSAWRRQDFSKKCYFSFVKRCAVFTKAQYVL